MGWMVDTTPRPLYPRERPGPFCIGGRVRPRVGLDWCGKIRSQRDSIPDRSARSKSLNQLSYLGPKNSITMDNCKLTFWRRNYFFKFSTSYIQNVNNTGTKHVILMKQTAF